MKARTLILTAGMAVALVALAAQPAAAMFPTDGGTSVGLLAGGKLQPVKATAGAKASATTIKASAYGKFAYVHGGSSARVGKAITAAGKRMAKQSQSQPAATSKGSTGTHVPSVTTWTPGPTVTPGSFDPGDNACLVYSVCTPEEDCAIWGYNCSLLEAPQVIPTPAPEPGPGDGWAYIEPPEILYPTLVDVSSQSSTTVSSTEETYEDC